MARALAAFAIVLSLAGDARAEDAKSARAHFEKGTVLFKVDKFREALAEYQAAYVAKPDPSFLFNIAQCHRKLGDQRDAARFYRKYLVEYRLDRGKEAPNAVAVQRFIDELEAAIANATQPPPPAAAPAGGGSPSPTPAAAPSPEPSPPPPAPGPPPAPAPVRESPPSAVQQNPFVLPQPEPSRWESAPQTVVPQESARVAPPPPALPAAPAPIPQPSEAAVDRYAARPSLAFTLSAAAGFATWKEDVSSQQGGDNGSYDTRANGPTFSAGGAIGVGYSRFFALVDFGYRYFTSGGNGAFLPSAQMNSFEAGGRAGLRTDHVGVWGRVGWAMTAIRIPRTSDDLPSEKLAGNTAGGGIDLKDLGASHLSFTARGDIGLSGERSQESVSGRDLSEGDEQTTKWSQWSVAAGLPLGYSIEAIGSFSLRLVDTQFEGFSTRLSVTGADTHRATTIMGLGAGLQIRR